MSTALAAVVLLAALACPVHMWWRHRRGAEQRCMPGGASSELDQLRARQLALSRRVAALAVVEPYADDRPATRAASAKA